MPPTGLVLNEIKLNLSYRFILFSSVTMPRYQNNSKSNTEIVITEVRLEYNMYHESILYFRISSNCHKEQPV